MQKVICRLIALTLLAGVLSLAVPQAVTVEAANTSGSFNERVNQLKKKFPNGKYWNHKVGKKNNPDGYTGSPCNHHGNCSKNGTDYSGSCGCNSYNGKSIQCMGFAEKLGFDLFGTDPRTQWSKSYNVANIKAGDIVRYQYHSIFVTKVSGDTLTYADCNSDGHCKIRWDAKISKSALRNLEYIQHANNYSSVNNKKNISQCKVSGIKASYPYTGKAITPNVIVRNGNAALKKGKDYVLTYKNNVSTGKASVKIEGKGSYKGTVTRTYRIVPKKGILLSVSPAGAGQMQVKWEKDRQVSGYEILLAADREFKNEKRCEKVSGNNTASRSIQGLKPGKRYYVKIRSYKMIDGGKRYGVYSSVKTAVCE